MTTPAPSQQISLLSKFDGRMIDQFERRLGDRTTDAIPAFPRASGFPKDTGVPAPARNAPTRWPGKQT